MKNEKVRILLKNCDDELTTLVNNIVEKLRKVKFLPLEIVKEGRAHVEIAQIEKARQIKDIGKSEDATYLFVVKGEITGDELEWAGELDTAGIFKYESLMADYEEMGRFQKCLKDQVRRYLYASYTEESEFLTKPVDWKIKTHDINYERNKMISIFFDETMIDFSRKLRNVVKNYMTTLGTGKSYGDLLRDARMGSKKNLRTERKIPAILITGASGAGKTLVASYIAQKVTDGRMVRIPVVNLSGNLVDSELFGVEEGAFTDAKKNSGKIEAHVGETVFIDEIGEVFQETQAKLLSYLDDMKILRVGDTLKKDNYRPTLVIAATNKNLESEIEKGKFRLDLYNRFRYRIHVPSLEERKFDIRFLISFILQDPSVNPYLAKERRTVERISLAAISFLEKRRYPGNYRQLESILTFAVQKAEFEGRKVLLARDFLEGG